MSDHHQLHQTPADVPSHSSGESAGSGKVSKARRIIAWIAIILLAGLYIAALLAAVFSSPGSGRLLRFTLGMTIAVPIAAWILIYAIGYFTKKHTIASVDLLNSNPQARKEMEDALHKELQQTTDTDSKESGKR